MQAVEMPVFENASKGINKVRSSLRARPAHLAKAAAEYYALKASSSLEGKEVRRCLAGLTFILLGDQLLAIA